MAPLRRAVDRADNYRKCRSCRALQVNLALLDVPKHTLKRDGLVKDSPILSQRAP